MRRLSCCFITSEFARHATCGELPFDTVYVVNLDRRPDRWAKIQEQLGAAGLSCTRFPAVDGADLCAERLRQCGLLSDVAVQRLALPPGERIWGMDLTPGAVGCALSHLRLWALIAMGRQRAALVLEDDSLIRPDFVSQFRQRWTTVPPDWEMVYVSSLDTGRRGHLLTIPGSPGFRYVHQLQRTTNAYVISSAGAETLLDILPPLTFQLDTELTLRTRPHAVTKEAYVYAPRSYTMYPPLIVQATSLGSDIQLGNSANPVAEEISRKREAGWLT